MEGESFEKKLFHVVRELNVSQDRVVDLLEAQGYKNALSGSGLNAKITVEEAYLLLRKEYANDAEAAARLQELRKQEKTGGADTSGDETSSNDTSERDISLDDLGASKQTVEEDPVYAQFRQILEDSSIDIPEEDIVEGHVVRVDEDNVVIDIGYKSDGLVSRDEFVESPHPGDTVEVYVQSKEGRDG